MNTLKKDPMTREEYGYKIELTDTVVVDELENIRYTTYGIRVSDEQGNILYIAQDVGTKKEYVQRFIEMCVQGDAAAIHIPDLLEDYLE